MLIIQNHTNYACNKIIDITVNTLLQHFTISDEVVVKLVNINEITMLNHKYRFKNYPTNVLSFISNAPKKISNMLGDIIICPKIISNEAVMQHKLFTHHLIHIIVHGFLHLIGYNHIKDRDSIIMQDMEVKILANFNVNNPY